MDASNIEPLSHSSSNEILGCEQKYIYRKVQKVERDQDAPVDTLALDIGSCIHQCLEDTDHSLQGYTKSKIKENMDRYNVPSAEFDLIFRMLSNYRDLHDKSELKCIDTEVEIVTKDFIGYIDAIMEDKNGLRWILDVKTASRKNNFLPSLLPRDKQLNLYLHQYPKEVEGCIYRVVYKTKTGGARDYIIPKAAMNPKDIFKDFKALRQRQKELWKKPEKARKNYNNCTSYFRPCEYWSKCHGSEYTEQPRVTEVSV